MIIELNWPTKIRRTDAEQFKKFTQGMINSLMQGYPRYEAKWRSLRERIEKGKYLWRLERELKAYKKTGKSYHLRNLANYAYLEDQAPQNPKHHQADEGESVTRESTHDEKFELRRWLYGKGGGTYS